MKKRFQDDIVPENTIKARQEMAQLMKTARLEQHLTQETLATKCGTQKSNISRMESGHYNPSLDFLVKVADSMDKQLVIRME